MSRTDRAGTLEQRLHVMSEALQKEFPEAAEPVPVRFAGEMTTSGAMLGKVTTALEAFVEVHRAQRAFRRAVASRRDAMKASRSLYEDAVCFLKHYLGKDSPRLAQFGVASPKVRRALTAEALAISRAKASETRRLRGTLGRRQRLALGKPREATLQVFGPDGQPLGTVPAEAEPQPSS